MRRVAWAAAVAVPVWLAACGGGGGGDDDEGGGNIPAASREVVVLAWNDLGMHCLNPTYDTAVILPPYNTVWAQVVRRGNPPELVTSGVTVEYRILNNTYSDGKAGIDPVASDFSQFWTYAQDLFGVALDPNTGLNLKDPGLHNGLSGTMVAQGDHFEVDGIPLTPIDDSGVWSPYQVAEITVKDLAGAVLAQTRATVPTSDEIRCDGCHGAAPFADILSKHDANEGTTLAAQTPVLCASCHGSPALGAPLRAGIPYLSQAIHTFHAGVNPAPACYDCHPGQTTQCNRSLRHATAQIDCTNVDCHGSLANVGSSIAAGRVPWVGEPRCATCHKTSSGGNIPEVDTGSTLYRDSVGHGGLGCPACHGSPHAMVPSREAADNYQAIQYQGAAVSLGSCAVCHGSSKGRGLGEFNEEHGGSSGRRTACHVCHTAVSAAASASWPHSFQWNAR